MASSREIAKDQWVGSFGYASLSTSPGARLHRSGMDPRVKPEDDEGTGGPSQSQVFVIGGNGATCTSSFQGGAIEDRADPGIHA